MSHPSIYTQIRAPYGKVWMRRCERCVAMFSLPPNAAEENQKQSPSLVALTPMGTWKWRLHSRLSFFFNDGPFFKGVLFHLEEIFIVNPLPVARFEHAVPYVVFCLATLLLKPRISDLSSWDAAQPESLIQVCWWSLLMFSWLQSLQSEYLNFKTKMQMLRNQLKPWEKVKASRMV